MNDLSKAKEALKQDGYTCVLCRDDEIVTSCDRGVKPLVALKQSKRDFAGFCCADKVVGKATAFLYVLLGVKAVYALVISKSALDVLLNNNIIVEYESLVENIINRKGDGICPFESAVLCENNPQKAYEIIRAKMKEMNITI